LTLAAPEDGKAVAAIHQLIGKEIPLEAMADVGPAELDFAGGDRRRGRGRRTPTYRENGHAGAPNGSSERPSRNRPRRDRATPTEPRERATPAEPRERAAEPVAVFPKPVAKTERPAQPDRRVVGFGDDLPAFLRRAPRVAAGA